MGRREGFTGGAHSSVCREVTESHRFSERLGYVCSPTLARFGRIDRRTQEASSPLEVLLYVRYPDS